MFFIIIIILSIILYREHTTNISIMEAITEAAGPQELLLVIVKRRKLQWFGHTTRHNTLAKEILQSTVKGGRKRRRPQQIYMDNIRECEAAHNRPRWRKVSVEASKRAPLRSARLRGIQCVVLITVKCGLVATIQLNLL